MRNGSRATIKQALLAGLAAGALLTGCGGGGSDPPEQVVSDFFAAVADMDAGQVCELISEETAQAAADQSGGETCEAGASFSFDAGGDQAIAAVKDVEVGEATIDGDSASVQISSMGQKDEVALVKEGDDWKIDAGV